MAIVESGREYRISLMGRPCVQKVVGAHGKDLSINGDAQAMQLLALWILSWKYVTGETATEDGKVLRDWLASRMSPGLFAEDRQGARDNVAYLLGKFKPLKLREPLWMEGQKRERRVVGLNLSHVSVDLLEIEAYFKQQKYTDVRRLAETPLLHGMAYSWLQEPAFRRVRAQFDSYYVYTLLWEVDRLLFATDSNAPHGNHGARNGLRQQAIPLLEAAHERLHTYTEEERWGQDSPLRALEERLTRLYSMVGYPSPISLALLGSPEQEKARPATSLGGTTASVSNNLPKQLPGFIGREAAKLAVKEMLANRPLVTITGAGGCGKTRLAQQVASELLASEEGYTGIWFVDLASLQVPERVLPAVATTVGVQEQPGQPLEQTVMEFLADNKTLLIFDNCEHLVEACATTVERLLQGCANLHILATSREALCIGLEQHYKLPSLSCPNPRDLPFVTDGGGTALEQFEAVRLFVERARERNPAFQLQGYEADVAKICFSLDGMPLAIELAAAWIGQLTPSEIANKLDDRLSLLVHGSRTVRPRHQTMQATIDWSYQSLPASEALLLAQLSIFVGGWNLKAAEAVCPDLSAAILLELQASLLRKSLMERREGDGQSRYYMLQTIGEYAHLQLQKSGMVETIAERHLDYYVAQAGRVAKLGAGSELNALMEDLGRDRENLRAALDYSLATKQFEKAMQLAADLSRYWVTRGYEAEGQAFQERILACGTEASPTLRRSVLHSAASLAYIRNDYPRANDLWNECLELSGEIGDEGWLDRIHANLGNVALDMLDLPRARALMEQARLGFQRRNNRRGLAQVLGNMSRLARYEQDYAQAHALLDASLRLFREQKDDYHTMRILNNQAYLLFCQDRYEEAYTPLAEALELSLALDNRTGVAECLTNYMMLAAGGAQWERAAFLVGADDALRQETGYPIPLKAQVEVQTARQQIVVHLGSEAFDIFWNAGRRTGLPEVCRFAKERITRLPR